MIKLRASLACVVALVLSGCGGGMEMEESAPETTIETTEQSLLYACDGRRAFNRYWFQNGVEVGREYCDCDGTLTKFGTTQGRYTQEVISYCSF